MNAKEVLSAAAAAFVMIATTHPLPAFADGTPQQIQEVRWVN